MRYDLEERTSIFAEELIEVSKKIPKTTITVPLISQLIRSATSIGANYQEANGASSKKDFANKIYICKKEAMETRYWLRLLTKAVPDLKDQFKKLGDEVQELIFIFSRISKTLKTKQLRHSQN